MKTEKIKMTEYVIWGCDPKISETDEMLLIVNYDGKKITDKKLAEKLMDILSINYNCKNCRIQAISFEPNWDAIKAFAATVHTI